MITEKIIVKNFALKESFATFAVIRCRAALTDLLPRL